MWSKQVENFSTIHFIWIGGPLRQQDLERVKLWAQENPSKRISLWCETKFAENIKTQLGESRIEIKLLETIPIPEHVKILIQRLTEPRSDELVPNYAAAGDVYKAYILNHYKGWYFDVGTQPFKLNTIQIYQFLNFMFVGMRADDNLIGVNMGAIASDGASVLAQSMIRFFELTAEELSKESNLTKIRSNIASVRMLATMLSTGFALKAALTGIYIKELEGPLIHCFDENHNHIPKRALELFDSLSHVPFDEDVDRTWMFDNKGKPLGKIIIDEDYVTSRKLPPNNAVGEKITMTHCRDIVAADIRAVQKMQKEPLIVSLRENAKALNSPGIKRSV